MLGAELKGGKLNKFMGHKLVWIRYVFHWIRKLFEPKVDWSKIDKTGIVKSDYPVVDKGWIKGWVSGKNEIIVCKHSGVAVGNVVYVVKNSKKVFRTIESIDNTYSEYDIAICKVSKDWPDDVKIYKKSEKLKKMQLMCVIHKDDTFSTRRALFQDKMVFGTYYTREIIYGDSGLPWFVWEDGEFKVCSHSFKGIWGVGPNYSEIF